MSSLKSRNELCWCGSGQKYKKCHMKQDQILEEKARQGFQIPRRKLIKTREQIAGIRQAGYLTARILDMVGERIRAGVTTDEVNTWVHEMTIAAGAYPAPLNYKGFPKSTCTSINDVICHGIPGERILEEGDIVNVDVTSILNGYYGDASRMYMIGEVSPEARKLVEVARECTNIGIEMVKAFNTTGDIGYAIEQHALSHGYSVVRDFGGHGIGIEFHEDPFVQHYGSRKYGMVLVPGMVITVEPMVNTGAYQCRVMPDNWTTLTVDGGLSAQWEHTVLVTESGYEILTL